MCLLCKSKHPTGMRWIQAVIWSWNRSRCNASFRMIRGHMERGGLVEFPSSTSLKREGPDRSSSRFTHHHVTLSKPNPVLGTPSQNTPSQNGSLEWWSFARKGAGTSAFNQLCVGWSKFSLFSFLSRNAELMNDAWHDFGDRKQDYLSWISFTRSWR